MHVKEGAYSLGVMAPSLDGKTLLSCGPVHICIFMYIYACVYIHVLTHIEACS